MADLVFLDDCERIGYLAHVLREHIGNDINLMLCGQISKTVEHHTLPRSSVKIEHDHVTEIAVAGQQNSLHLYRECQHLGIG